ncbi:MAG: L-ectoine synthase [Porticoccaceae bacterium]|nr:MAG: L-ectoine synthase [Porticoccaceae bacterium]
MIVRTLEEVRRGPRHVVSDGWESTRLLLRSDGMGFSFHITTIHAGAVLPMHYKHHLESVYCISGRGTLEDCATGRVYPIGPGTLYALDRHDRHVLRAEEEMVMACVFNPPLHGREVHNAEGAYEPVAEAVE